MERPTGAAGGIVMAQRATLVRRVAVALAATLSLAGCEKHHGEAIVLAKEHIAAAEPRTETPAAETPGSEPSASPDQPEASPTDGEETISPIADDEITVGQHVMKKEVRGTSRDPRALSHEQWLVKVQMIDNGRTFNVPVDQAPFDRLKEGDHVQVTYHTGKYTGTVWGAELEEK